MHIRRKFYVGIAGWEGEGYYHNNLPNNGRGRKAEAKTSPLYTQYYIDARKRYRIYLFLHHSLLQPFIVNILCPPTSIVLLQLVLPPLSTTFSYLYCYLYSTIHSFNLQNATNAVSYLAPTDIIGHLFLDPT